MNEITNQMLSSSPTTLPITAFSIDQAEESGGIILFPIGQSLDIYVQENPTISFGI